MLAIAQMLEVPNEWDIACPLRELSVQRGNRQRSVIIQCIKCNWGICWALWEHRGSNWFCPELLAHINEAETKLQRIWWIKNRIFSSLRYSCRSGFSASGFWIRLAFWVGKGERDEAEWPLKMDQRRNIWRGTGHVFKKGSESRAGRD